VLNFGEDVVVFAVDEFDIRRLLADLDHQPAAEQRLLDPHLVEASSRQRLDAAHQHQVADIIARQAVAMDLEDVGVEGRA
jgi:hypothetical protein